MCIFLVINLNFYKQNDGGWCVVKVPDDVSSPVDNVTPKKT